MQTIIEQYNREVDNLPRIHQEGGGGNARNASGLVYENLIKRTCDRLGLDAKKNDYVKTEEVNGYCLSNLQVDWHVYRNNRMKKAIESKTYNQEYRNDFDLDNVVYNSFIQWLHR